MQKFLILILYELPIDFKILDNKRYELSYKLNDKKYKTNSLF